jgi:NAD(P)-dependent dehydrogenase (short-subunit alcohol dehydrogenase family)
MKDGRRVVITGAGQGLGLEWARQEIADGAMVLATARDPEGSPALAALQREAGAARLTILPMDVADDASVERGARAAAEHLGAVDLLVNNAGIFGPRDDRALAGPPSEVTRVLEINAVGPYRVTRAFLPLLRQGAQPRVVFITSRMGSIGDRPSGGSYAYRMSKSALNMLAANLAHDLGADGIVCLLFHPGWVQTRMGGKQAPILAPDAIAGMRRVAEGSTPEQSGGFFDHQGAVVPW